MNDKMKNSYLIRKSLIDNVTYLIHRMRVYMTRVFFL